jgi:large conductance mechanosensitive channel
VSSLVADVLLPPVGLAIGGVDFSGLAVTIKNAAGASPAVLVKYGTFLNTVVDFVIVAFALFIVIKGMNKMMMKKEAPPPATKDCPECLMAIPIQAKKCGHCTSPVR